MNKRVQRHVLFWILVLTILTLYFGRINRDYIQAFYFVSMLMPVAVGTAYFFNYFLVPNYLLKRKYFQFGLYLIYTIIITLYLEMIVITLSFIFLANYHYDQMNPLTVDSISVAVTIYLIVVTLAFFRTIKSFQKLNSEKKILSDNLEKEKQQILTVTSERKQVPILLNEISFIESLADYVQIHHKEFITITKEKISTLEKKLPQGQFIRSHRSFIVNINHIESYDRENINLKNNKIPISRTYKKGVIESLQSKLDS